MDLFGATLRCAWPWALVVIPAGAAYCTLRAWRSPRGLRSPSAVLALGWRLAVLAALALALARPRFVATETGRRVAFIVDVSRSVADAADRPGVAHGTREARAFIRHVVETRAGPDDQASYLVAAGEPAIEIPFAPAASAPPGPGAAPPFQLGEHWMSRPNRDATNLAAALRLARMSFPAGHRARIVLMTDGNETAGRAALEAARARGAGVPVDVFPLRARAGPDVVLQRLSVRPEQVRPGEPVLLEALVASDLAVPVRWVVRHNGAELPQPDAGRRALPPGRSVQTLGPFVLPPPDAGDEGLHRFEVEAVPESRAADERPQNNRAEALALPADQRPRVLIVEGVEARGAGADLEAALRADPGLVVRRVPSTRLPERLAAYQAIDLLAFANVPAYEVSESQMEQVRVAVRDLGLGFLMLGGDRSFGASGYNDTPLEALLPVDMEPRQHRVMPQGALALILHTCEIPDRRDWGKRIAKEALRVLNPQDEAVAIFYDVASGDEASRLFPLAPVGPPVRRTHLSALIDAMQNGDMPGFEPCVQAAYDDLRASRAAKKHVILVSDGDPSPPPVALLEALAAAGISLSTVLIGPDGDAPTLQQRMAQMAALTGGRAYVVTDPEALPQIFIKEASLVKRGLVSQQPFQPRVRAPSPLLAGVDLAAMPPLGGYVLTTPKAAGADGAPPPVQALVGPEEDPLLAHWNYGLGTTAAFTSDAAYAGWAADWAAWPQFGAYWRRLVRGLLRRVARSEFRARLSPSDGAVEVTVEAVDEQGRFQNGLTFDAAVVGPDLARRPVELRPAGTGLYRGSFSLPAEGAYQFTASHGDRLPAGQAGGGQRRFLYADYVQPYSPEFRSAGPDEALLAAIAEQGGGRVLDPDDRTYNPFTGPEPPERVAREWWRELLLLAGVLLLCDVAFRRLDLGLLAALERRWRAARARRAQRGPRAGSPSASLRAGSRDGPPAAVDPFAPPGRAARSAPVRASEEVPDGATTNAPAAADRPDVAPPPDALDALLRAKERYRRRHRPDAETERTDG